VIETHTFTVPLVSGDDPAPHTVTVVKNKATGFRCEITESPTGRNYQVHVTSIDGAQGHRVYMGGPL
jgi:hypothetical protein